MLKSVHVNGRAIGPPIHDTDRVTLDLCPTYATHRCHACDEDLVHTRHGHQGIRSGSLTCATSTEPPGDATPHVAWPIPLVWCNGAAIATDEADDTVTVIISVGDPRGGFTFTVRRMSEVAHEHPGRLVLSTPYPGEPMPHLSLTELRPGTYLVAE